MFTPELIVNYLIAAFVAGMMLGVLSGCSRHYEREQPRSQICKDLGKWDCK